MRSIYAAIASVLALTACGPTNDEADRVFGIERSLIILEKSPIVIASKPMSLTGDGGMKIMGGSTLVCFVLKGDVGPKDDSGYFDRAMEGIKVRTEVILADGRRVEFHQPMPAWSANGRVLKKGELSACASPTCNNTLAAGVAVRGVEVRAEPPLHVQGVFWNSETGPNTTRKPAPRVPASCGK